MHILHYIFIHSYNINTDFHFQYLYVHTYVYPKGGSEDDSLYTLRKCCSGSLDLYRVYLSRITGSYYIENYK